MVMDIDHPGALPARRPQGGPQAIRRWRDNPPRCVGQRTSLARTDGPRARMPAPRAGGPRSRGRRLAAVAVVAIAAAGTAPGVLAAEVTTVVISSSAQTYSPAGTPDKIEIDVNFDETVYVTGKPVFALVVGTRQRQMSYIDGSGSATLGFEYEVQVGDVDEDGVGYPKNALTGGTIRDEDNVAADREFPAVARAPQHKVDGVAPRLVATPLQITSNPARRGTYAPGETIMMTLRFDEDVDGAGTDESLELHFDAGVTREAERGAPDGGTLSFVYTVGEGDLDTNGFVVPSSRFMVADIHGNVDHRSTPALSSAQNVDGVRPAINGTRIVSNPGADRTYGEGDAIIVEVTFSEPVAADTSTFTLLVGEDESRPARYLSGDDTARVRYSYTVVAGDRDADGISYETDALLGTIEDRVGNELDGGVEAVTAQTGHRVDTPEDTEPPVVAGLAVASSPDRADTYAVGQHIELEVEFSEAVVVVGSPAMDLGIGTKTGRAAYVLGSGTDNLTFRYTVVADDEDDDGIAVGPLAESLVGGTIRDASGNTAIRTFAGLPAQRRHKVDGIAPEVTGATVTSDAGPDSTYALGDEIEIEVDFSEPVVASHDLGLHLDIGLGERTADAHLVAGERTRSLTFRYRVRQGDLDADGISIAATALSGGRPQDLAGNNAEAAQAELELAAQPAHRVDAAVNAAAEVRIVSSAGPDNTYALGDLIEVVVVFDEDVMVAGNVGLLLSFGPNEGVGPDGTTVVEVPPVRNARRRATLVRQTARVLTFHYRVQAGDRDEDGLRVDEHALTGGTVVDLFGNPARLAAIDAAAAVDGVQPVVEGISIVSDAGEDDTYGLGDAIWFEASFDEIVHTNDMLSLFVQIGPEARRVELFDGSGTQTLRFRYVVALDDHDADGISVRSRALSCGDEADFGCITDAAGNPVDEPVDGLQAQPLHKVDGRLLETRLAMASAPSSGDTYGAGERIEVRIDFPAPVYVNGDPELLLRVGSGERRASFIGGSATRSLLFGYTVRAGDRDADGVSIGPGPTALRGGGIVDGDNVEVLRSFAGLGPLAGHRVDGIAPAATLARIVSTPPGGEYGVGDEIRVQVTFGERIHVRDASGLALVLAVGPRSRRAAYLEGSGTRTLDFGYRVTADDRDADGVSIGPDAVVGGVVEDDAGNDWAEAARRIPPVPPSDAHRVNPEVDNVSPRLVDNGIAVVSTAADSAYATGEAIRIEARFDEIVHVTGEPALALSIGAAIRQAALATGSGTRTLEFRYVVQLDDADYDGISVGPGPGSLAGGTITDAAGNPADRSHPGLSADRGHIVDGRGSPAMVREVDVRSSPPRGSIYYRAGDAIEVTVEFTEVVHATGQPALVLSVGANDHEAGYAGGSGTDELLFRYTVRPGDADDDGISIGANALRGGTITNAAGSAAARGFAAEPLFRAHRVDARAAVVDAVEIGDEPASGGEYGIGETIRIVLSFDEEVFVTGTPVVALAIGAATGQAVYEDGSGTGRLAFAYVVRPGDADDDGISIPANGLTGGEITDRAGNPVDRRFGALPADAGHRVGDSDAPVVASIEMLGPPGGDTFILDDRIEVSVVFSEAVVVVGSPAMDLGIGTETRPAAYVLGSGTDTLVFRYRVVADDEDDDGVSIPAAALPDGAVADIAGNPADLDLGAAQTRFRFNVDAVAPYIDEVNIVPPASGETFVLGAEIEVRAIFSEAVTVVGQPIVDLLVGTETRRARYAGGGGTETLAFRYRVAAGDEDEDGVSIAANALSGGTIADLPGNRARRAFDAVPADARFKVDAVVPAVDVVEIISDAGTDSTYVPGDAVEVRATFTDAVHVTGEPVLTLSIGANSRPAAFATGSGSVGLLFRYTVVEGDYDEDGISIAANAITGGTIADDSGNPVDRAFAAVAAQSDHRVGAETSLQLASITLRVGGDHPPIDLGATLAAGGISYAGAFAVASDAPAVVAAAATGPLLTLTPLSEGTATIVIVATRAPITLVLPVTVQASAAETAVLHSALAAVGRGLLGSAADMIGTRLELTGMPRAQGGYRANYGGPATPPGGGPDGFETSAWHGPGRLAMPGGFVDHGARSSAAPHSYRPTSFATPLAGVANTATSWGVWGAAAAQAFEGTPEAGSYDGNLTSFHLGADIQTDDWVAGASVGHSQANVDYAFAGDATGAGTLDTSLTALHPYVQWRPGPGTTVWTVLGFGTGEVFAERDGRSAQGEPANLGMRLGLAGMRADLGRTGGIALALRGDAGFVQLSTEDGLRAVDGLSVQAQRARAGVEASRPVATANGMLSPFLELGARWDGGDGAAGGGVELAGGVRYRGVGGGVEVKARTLAMHRGEGVAEHGIAATAYIEPGPRGTGLRLSLTPRWGTPESRDVFWQSDQALRGMRPDPDGGHWMLDAQVGYGFALRGRPGRLEPFGALAGSPRTTSRARAGVRYETAGGHGASRYEVSTERVAGMRRVDHRLLLRAEARF